MRRTKWKILILTSALALTFVGAQATAAPQPGQQQQSEQTTKQTGQRFDIYQVAYRVNEMESGKTVNSRSYTLTVKAGTTGTLRIGSRVPYGVAKDSIQYQDVGMNIGCDIKPKEGNLVLHTKVEMLSVSGKGAERSFQSVPNPVFSQFEIENNTVVTLGKPDLVGAADEMASNRHYEIEVTVTKAN